MAWCLWARGWCCQQNASPRCLEVLTWQGHVTWNLVVWALRAWSITQLMLSQMQCTSLLPWNTPIKRILCWYEEHQGGTMGGMDVDCHAFCYGTHTGWSSWWHTKTFSGHETNERNNPIKASLGAIVENNSIEARVPDVIIRKRFNQRAWWTLLPILLQKWGMWVHWVREHDTLAIHPIASRIQSSCQPLGAASLWVWW